MEIINDNEGRTPAKTADVVSSRNVYLGVVFILAGLVWMFHNFHIISDDLFHGIFSWQMLLIVTGGYLLAVGKRTAGVIVGMIGLVFGAAEWLHFCVSIRGMALPAVLIAVGIGILLQKKGK